MCSREYCYENAVIYGLGLVLALTAVQVVQAQDWQVGAEGREVNCSLQVKGKTYLKGTCKYNADKDGHFVYSAINTLCI